MRAERSRRLWSAIIVAAVFLTAFAFAGPVDAGGRRYSSSVSLRYSSGQQAFHGQVRSSEPDCIGDREVRIFRRDDHDRHHPHWGHHKYLGHHSHWGHHKHRGHRSNWGRHSHRGHRHHRPELVVSTRTSDDGSYRVSYPRTSGEYFATVEKVTVPGYSETMCRDGQSRDVTVRSPSRRYRGHHHR